MHTSPASRGHAPVPLARHPRPASQVLREALRGARGDGAVGIVLGDTSNEEKAATFQRFAESERCHALLCSARSNAEGLTLTAANHCLLLDLQDHEGRELQLINRIWRIGQDKPVYVKRLVAAGTIEERMLHLRKRSKGLMANESDADTMTTSHVGEAGATEQEERTEELRYLFNAVQPEA